MMLFLKASTVMSDTRAAAENASVIACDMIR